MHLDETTDAAEQEESTEQPTHAVADNVSDIVLFTRVALDRVLAGAHRFTWETENLRPDGTTVSSTVTARPLVVEGEVVGIIEDFRESAEGRLGHDVAQHLATHDALTALPNRLLLDDRMNVAIAHAARERLTPAVLFCDIDDFKVINDTWGHQVGDEVLRHVARAIGHLVRRADTVARFGGDEIVVLLPHAKAPAQAELVATKILECLRVPQRYQGASLPVAMSIGIALLREGESADSLLRRADAAMYQAKELGGDGYRVAGA